jgi:hypothetical protein
MASVFVTNDALIEVDSAPVHTNHLRFERNLCGSRARGQDTCLVYCHPAIEQGLYYLQELATVERQNGHTEWLNLIPQECEDQHSKR